MKIAVEVVPSTSGIAGQFDVKDLNGNVIIGNITPAIPFDQFEIKDDEGLKEISLNKILKLKEAGFDSDEIIKMNQEGML